MKNTKNRIWVLCILSAILVSGVNFAAAKPANVDLGQNRVTTAIMQQVDHGALLGDGELNAVVGGATGCARFYGCYYCCLDLWIIEICVTVCFPW
ncbi:MAG: hypothetical protein WBD36_00335 [Bacteroidota bacterium]